MFKNQNRKVRS